MNTAVLPNGVSYNIPLTDMAFFKKLAARMKWETVGNANPSIRTGDVEAMKQTEVAKVSPLELDQAMSLMDTMMIEGEQGIPAEENCNGALAREKYGV